MKIIDKILVGLSGVGAVVIAADYLRKRGEPKVEVYACPYCRQSFEATYLEFAKHIADERRAR
jgi:hypothetical protein